MCIKGHFRSAKCFNNSIHVNEVRSARSKEREGGREGEEVGIGSRVTDMVMVLYFQLPLHCPSEGPITIVRRGEEKKEEKKGAIAQRATERGYIRQIYDQNARQTHRL